MQKIQKWYTDRHCRKVQYDVQKVLLSTKNLRLRLPSKLQDCYVGPFGIFKRVVPTAYKLDLTYLAALRQIHSVFDMNLLSNNGFREQPLPIKVDSK